MRTRLLPKTGRLALSLALVLTLLVMPITASATDGSAASAAAYAPDRVLVGFKPGTPAKNVAAAHASLGAKVQGRIPQIGVEIVEVPSGRSVHGMIKMYLKNPNVQFAEPDYLATVASVIPDDPLYRRQWGHEYVNTAPAWGVTTGSTNVTIAILDTGLDLTHPDLAGRLVPGYDFVNRDTDPTDDHGHGTRVTGIAAATGNNGLGVAGVDWNARVMPVKVLDASGVGAWSAISQGIIFAADNGAQVVNMSLAGPRADTLHSALKYAHSKGCTLVAASGNSGTDVPYYPAVYPEVIAVGSVVLDSLSTFSNYGPHLDVVAPGETIETTVRGGTYGRFTGTSAAAPWVSGLAALLYGASPGASPDAVRAAITSSARDLGAPGRDDFYGWGLIDAAGAFSAIGAGGAPIATEPPTGEPAPEPQPEPEPEPAPEPTPVSDPEPEPTAPVDTTPPVVSISSPADGSTVSGLVTIRADASDDVGVVRVEFYVNGSLQGTSTSAEYSTNWNTRKLSGEYTLTAIAYDAAGNAGTSTLVRVTVGTAEKTPPGKKK